MVATQGDQAASLGIVVACSEVIGLVYGDKSSNYNLDTALLALLQADPQAFGSLHRAHVDPTRSRGRSIKTGIQPCVTEVIQHAAKRVLRAAREKYSMEDFVEVLPLTSRFLESTQ